MTVQTRRGTPIWIPLLIVGAILLAFFGAALAIAIALNSGPGWQVSATNQSDGVLVEAFIGDAVEPNFSVVLEGRSIPRNAVRATPEEFDLQVVAPRPDHLAGVLGVRDRRRPGGSREQLDESRRPSRR